MNQKSQQNNKDLFRYGGLGAQLFAGIVFAVFVGYMLDKWLKISAPLFLIGLPVISLLGMFYKIIKDTSNTKDQHEEK